MQNYLVRNLLSVPIVIAGKSIAPKQESLLALRDAKELIKLQSRPNPAITFMLSTKADNPITKPKKVKNKE